MAIAHRSIILASPIRLQTYSTYDTPGYPVGVFNLNGTFLGFAANQAQYVTVWNADPVNAAAGTISAGPTPLTFNCTNTLPGKLIGLRYWQINTTRRVSLLTGNNSLVYLGTGQPTSSATMGTLRGAGIMSSFNFGLGGGITAANYPGSLRQINIDYVTVGSYTVTVFHSEDDKFAGYNALNFWGGTGTGQISNMRGNLPAGVWDVEFLEGESDVFAPQWKNTITNWNELTQVRMLTFNMGTGATNSISNNMPPLAPYKSTLAGLGIAGNRAGAGPQAELGLDSTFTNFDFLFFEYNPLIVPFFTGNNFPLMRFGFAFRYGNPATLTPAIMDNFLNNIVANSGYSTIVTSNGWSGAAPRLRIGSNFTAASLAARTTLASRGYIYV